MSVLETLTIEERYLLAILQDESGVDIAEFTWQDQGNPDNLFRCYPFQYHWYRNKSKNQIDMAARSIGKSVGIQMRAFAFPFNNGGQEMLITAPELIHLDPVTKNIEDRILSCRLGREMLNRRNGSTGFRHRPFEASFNNGAKIVGRIPQKDGKGVKTCVSGDVLVLTTHGMVPADSIRVGDYVLTHEGRYMPVLHVYSYPDTPTVCVSGAGHRGLVVSEKHSFYARRNNNPQRTRNLSRATWVRAVDEEIARHYWASPNSFPELELPDLPDGITDGVELLALAGRYVADGTVSRGTVSFVDSETGIKDIEQICESLGLSTTRRGHDNAVCTTFYSRVVAEWLVENFGHLAGHKFIPSWLLGAPLPARQSFLYAYLMGDGCWISDKQRFEASSASKKLALGVKLLGQSLGMRASFTWVKPKVTSIKGRELVKEAQMSYRVQLTEHGHAIIDDGLNWSKIRLSNDSVRTTVYDFVVAEDFSYVGDGIVHLGSSSLPGSKEIW